MLLIRLIFIIRLVILAIIIFIILEIITLLFCYVDKEYIDFIHQNKSGSRICIIDKQEMDEFNH